MSTSFSVGDIEVDYDLAVDKAVEAGRYDHTDHNITAEHFPAKWSGKATVTVELVHFYKDMSSDNVLAELEAQGLRPAELRELLALGAAYPKLQLEFPIVALGSDWPHPLGRRGVACLDKDDSKRDLELDWMGNGVYWSESCRFAAVRE